MIRMTLLKKNKSIHLSIQFENYTFIFTTINKYLSTRLFKMHSQKELKIFFYNYVLNTFKKSGIRQIRY